MKKKPFWRETLESLVIALVLAFFVRTFLFQIFYIPSGSMEPTLMPGDRVLVSKIDYHFVPIQRFDVIVFRYPVDPSKDFIKRVIGLPGDTVQEKDGVIYINGQKLVENHPMYKDNFSYPATKVPENYYFVLGDNRGNSDDSRFWGFVPKQNIIGKAWFIIWPPGRIGIIPT